MKILINKFKTMRSIILVLSLNIILAGPLPAEQGENLRGEPFSDPSKQSLMPDDWKNKPVRYIPDFMKADIVIDLNQQIDLFLEPLVREYARANNLMIISTKGTCGKSAAKIDRKEVDIAAYCCPPGGKDRLPGLKYNTLGITPLAFFVHPSNTVSNVTLEQLRQIFMGDITNWSELEGPDLPIKLIASHHCSQRPGHWKLFLGDGDLFSADIVLTGEMEDMIAFIASNTGSIGYETVNVSERFKHRGAVNALKINGFYPTPENLLSLNYSIYRVFNVTSWEGEALRKPHTAKLVEYLIDKTQSLDEKAGILPASKMKKAGWKFHENEVIGEPDKIIQ